MDLIRHDDVMKILNDEIYTEECEFEDGDCVVCWVVDDKAAVIEKIKRLPRYKSSPKTTEYPEEYMVIDLGDSIEIRMKSPYYAVKINKRDLYLYKVLKERGEE